ncbi:GNAT family N-acetyltransferase [Sphingomonas bacterium]|uniref:GNAT family N-acetyltransferase n=1 Tax=Sphingomonas bacterium TaxID=1895847 RepID=UPI0015763719|nr:GNAT family N-acetyltransferase [Sphingomonas bacterium]
MPFAAEKVYFMRRARQSHAAMLAAADGGARLAHRQLESAYEGKADSLDRKMLALARGPLPAQDQAPPKPAISPDAVAAALVGEGVTRGGVALSIRPTTPADLGTLIALFRNVSAEDVRFRFGDTARRIGAAELGPLIDSDPDTGISFIAHESGGIAVAVSTLADSADGSSAEVALSVHAEWKARGIAWTLLEHTLAYATAHGLREVTSFETGDEHAAINLEREMGFVARLISISPTEFSLSKIVAG